MKINVNVDKLSFGLFLVWLADSHTKPTIETPVSIKGLLVEHARKLAKINPNIARVEVENV